MFEKEIRKYQSLNKLAEPNGIVILGGTGDVDIPLCELKQAFNLHSHLYNRSMPGLSIREAIRIYDQCIAALNLEGILLHIGADDLEIFSDSPEEFDRMYRELIRHIKEANRKCSVTVVSLKNKSGGRMISDMNTHLKDIAKSESCEYIDISGSRKWSPRETKDALSFVYSSGFVNQLQKKPVYDLVKILFCYEPSCI